MKSPDVRHEDRAEVSSEPASRGFVARLGQTGAVLCSSFHPRVQLLHAPCPGCMPVCRFTEAGSPYGFGSRPLPMDGQPWARTIRGGSTRVALADASGCRAGDHAERGRLLHRLAGMPARKVLELHGTARSAVCVECHARGPMEDARARVEAGEDGPSRLECGGALKSATVMFGQRLDPVVLGEAVSITKACRVFVDRAALRCCGGSAPRAPERLTGGGPTGFRTRRGG